MELKKVDTSKEPQPVLIVGSVGYDDIETPSAKDTRILGGSASYACLSSSYFAPTRMVAVVGNDFEKSDRKRLEDHGIDTTGLQVDDSGPTFTWSGKYLENFNERETLDIQLNVFEKFEPILPSSQKDSRYVLLGNIHPGLQAHVLDQLEAEDAFVAVDTIDLWITTAKTAFLELLKRVDFLVINDSESELLTGESNIIKAGAALRALGPDKVVIKKGAHGAYFFFEGGLFALPAYPVTELRDPTGAGDTFLGAVMGFLAARDERNIPTIKEALLYGTAVASLTVEAFSCNRLESGGAETIEKRVEELRAMISL
ncbi:MAG: PfkB family carbohydrate kinase [Puniceicoccales bacterium]